MYPTNTMFRPANAMPTRQRALASPAPRMGAIASMNLMDWVLLAGGGVVGGYGVNKVIGQFTKGKRQKLNAIPILLGVVLAGVGLSVFANEGQKLIS